MIATRLCKNALWLEGEGKTEFFNNSREKQDNHGSPAQLLIIGKMGQKNDYLLPTVILSECAFF
jgi:hypothetical protein